MKKIYSNIMTAALLVTGAAFTACSGSDSENIIEQPETSAVKTYKVSIEASQDGTQASTRAITDDGDHLRATWDVNDKVYVFGTPEDIDDNNNNKIGILTPDQTGDSYAYLNGNLTTVDNLEPNTQLTLKYRERPYYINQEGTLDFINSHNYALATVVINSINKQDKTMRTTRANFKSQQAAIKLTLASGANIEDVDIYKNGDKLCSAKQDPAKQYYLLIPSISEDDVLRFEFNHATIVKTKKGIKLENGKFYTINVSN
jgi:hypothetical protein